MAMGKQDWRVLLALLGASGWGWNITLEKLVTMRGNPGLYPVSQWVVLILIDVVLLIVDVWAIAALFTIIWPTEDKADADEHQQSVDGQGGGPR
jgi:hypothetical protein